jgi:hypothetical protein
MTDFDNVTVDKVTVDKVTVDKVLHCKPIAVRE